MVRAGSNPTTRQLIDSVVEGLDAVLLTVVEAMGPDGEDDRALLRQMSGDRGALMKRLREEYLASDASLAADGQDGDPDDHQPHRTRHPG